VGDIIASYHPGLLGWAQMASKPAPIEVKNAIRARSDEIKSRVDLAHMYSELEHFTSRELDVRAIAFMKDVRALADEVAKWRSS
jgi:hypothetical protein